ncbi:MAG: protein kinase, partial [Caulobacteraceae bacterium]
MTRPDDPGDGRTVIASDATDTPDTARPVRRAYGTLAPGDLLNGIYRVERFIARGGMGDVYEGVNVETDERVAIKAMRAHLAADAKVLALFRKEARVLTQFAHPAIVQYRVLAREPTLELYYIVMDFIDGEPLSSMLDGVRPGMGRVIDLGRRLASGLATAHEHGAIHRDMSPDNVLLPEGRVERARIIDFGIAKSLDVSVETVVGDGFAGKIGYVAPEQFGDFDRQVGPWTDVYSLGLVLLSYARGRSSDMGSTLAEAVERRRSGPKLDDLSPLLEPLLRRMLAANPRDRIQSMQEVIAELESIDLVDPEADPVIDEPQAPPHEEDPANAVEPSRPPAPLTTFVPVEEEAQPIPAEAAGTVPPAISAVSPDAASETVEATRPKRRWIALSGLGAVAVLG